MPSFLNCGSTWGPPGEYCLRHSLEKITNISEFSSPPLISFPPEALIITIIIIISLFVDIITMVVSFVMKVF
jgi:hypothetical protein